MKPDLSRPRKVALPTNSCKSNRSRPIIVLVVLTVGVGISYSFFKKARAPSSVRSANVSGKDSKPRSGAGQGDEELKPVVVQEEKPLEWRGVTRRDAGASRPPEAPSAPGTDVARKIIGQMVQVDIGGGALTLEQAQSLNRGFRLVAEQGAAAVPAIREFLQRNQDLSFSQAKGGNLVDSPSLRLGLFDLLKEIGGPEAVAASLDTMRTTAEPLEIAILARNLEALSPGQYRQEALEAARETLALAATKQVEVRDVGSLFDVFRTYGDTAVIADLEKAQPQWNYYATLALASLPDGEGIPALIRQAQDLGSGTVRDGFALQMLAQVATQYPDAGAVLLEQVRLNQVPDSAWRRIGMGLAGDQYQLGSPSANGSGPVPNRPGLKTYHIENGNQNFFSLPLSEAEQISQRLAVIDQLLAATSNPTAIQALQEARALLSGARRSN